MTVEWTPKRTESLIKLWKSGAPTSEIGRKLKVTKNAVVGKAHRLGLPKRQSPIRGGAEKPTKPRPVAKAQVKAQIEPKAKPKTEKKTAAKPAAKATAKAPAKPAAKPAAPPPAKAEKAPAPEPAPQSVPVPEDDLMPGGDVVHLENLTAGMCCWPIGEPGTPEFHFCGKRPTVPDKPYCLEHCTRAYVKSSKDRKESARS